jgi:hypothetical protein
MRSLKTSVAVMLLLLGCLLPMTSCKKDKFVEEIAYSDLSDPLIPEL